MMEGAVKKRGYMSRRQMLEWVMMLGFCAYDMMLYLDTHPTDSDALEYYEECNRMYQEAKRAYEEAYGPLTAESAHTNQGKWSWGMQPLPWEGGF